MWSKNILFNEADEAYELEIIKAKIAGFGNGKNGYKNTVHMIIQDSLDLDRNGVIFIKCTSKILSNFKMTRSGPFKEIKKRQKLLNQCWSEVGPDIFKIHSSIISSGLSRDRFLLELNQAKRDELINEIWTITKKLLPITMGETSYGLVGASKILFSVLPEIVLPIDNSQWVQVFKTVDLGDVIKRMITEIELWESATGMKLNEMDESGILTTLPSVYNVMAMAARRKRSITKKIK